MKRKARAARGPRNKPTAKGAKNPAIEALPTPEPTAAQARALGAIGALGKGANVLAIARALGVTRTGLQEKLAALEARGLIRPVYKRVVSRYTLTEAGERQLEPCTGRSSAPEGCGATPCYCTRD